MIFRVCSLPWEEEDEIVTGVPSKEAGMLVGGVV